MEENRKNGFAKYGLIFQENLVKLMILDRAFCNQIFEVLNLSFLESEYLRNIVFSLKTYKDKYKVHPTIATIKTIVFESLEKNEELAGPTKLLLVNLTHNTEVPDAEFIKNKSIEFCKVQKLKEAYIESMPYIDLCNFDKIKNIFEAAFKAGGDQTFGLDYFEDFDTRFEHIERDVIPTPWSVINDVTGGGWGKGELSVMMAPTGGGKSSRLVMASTAAAKVGFNVAYITLELKDSIISFRHDACLTQISLNDIKNNKHTVFEAVKELKGTLFIKEYPMKSASPSTVENYIEKLALRGKKPDLVCVDYGDLLAPTTFDKGGNSINDNRTVFNELKAISQRTNVAMLTATQTNRSGINAEILTLENVADAYAKCMVADFIITFSNKQKAYIAKNRNGDTGKTYKEIIDFATLNSQLFEHFEDDLKSQLDNSKNAYLRSTGGIDITKLMDDLRKKKGIK